MIRKKKLIATFSAIFFSDICRKAVAKWLYQAPNLSARREPLRQSQ
jgi:hypothetical protein